MSFSPIQGSALIEKQYKRYLGTMFRLKDVDYQRQFTEQLASHTAFVAGPYLDAHDNYATGRTTRQMVNEGLLSKYFMRYGFHHDRPLYTHQEQALTKALDGHNIVVSTGTGSGKTESFLMPILAALAAEAEKKTLSSGVRALLIYPMNALANDQVERLRELLENTPQVTFGCYTGQTKEGHTEALMEYEKLNGKKPQKNELISREQMKENPPHILITNYAMLEYLMVRPRDSVFFNDDTWRFAVLDEAHVYRGSTGIEVSMLLRRLKATLRGCKLQYFLTSATLGDKDEDDAVAEFARNLTDEAFSPNDVIRAIRVPVPKPESPMTVPDSLYRAIQDRIDAGEDEAQIDAWLLSEHPEYRLNPVHPLFDLIHRDTRYWQLRQILQVPSPINTISSKMGLSEDEIERLVSAASFSEADGIRLLDARYHTFLRATESVFVTLQPSKKLFLTRAKDYYESTDGQRYKVFEVNVCNSCGITYLTGKIDPITGCLEQSSKPGPKDVFYLGESASNTDEDGEEDESADQLGRICAICGHFQRSNVRGEASCEHDTKYKTAVVRLKTKGPDHRVKKCVCCEAVNNSGILRTFFTGQEAVTSVIATSLFNALPAKTTVETRMAVEEDEFGFGFDGATEIVGQEEIQQAKQFLCFSDSRQASAFFATYLDTTYRKLLYRRILTSQLKDVHGSMSLKDFCEDLSAVFEHHGILKGTGYRLEKESWKAVLAEAADMASFASLSGMGLMSFAIKPGLFSANPKLRMSAEEVQALFNVLIGSMINDLALIIPVAMTEEDREFYAYGAMGARYVGLGGNSAVNLKSFIPKSETRSNKRLDYLTRVMEKKLPGCFDSAKLRSLMMSLWKLMQHHEIILPFDDGYQLNIDKLCIARPSRWYRCDRCHKLVPWNIDGICTTYRCEGTLQPVDPDEELKNNHYYRLCHDMDMRPLRVKEHTAQLDRNKAYEYQQDFKDKKIDVLSCSTTFEMGVDVGSLETVFMRNMPPMPSNYAQRAGRAGRSRHSAAFALTFCNRSNHDFAYFDRPVDMISGKIQAPHFNIINEKIAIRHLYASAIAFFWRKYPEYFSTVGRMASEAEEGENGFSLLWEYLLSKPKDLRVFAQCFLPKPLYDAFDCDGFGWVDSLINEQDGVLTRAVSEYSYEVDLLEKAREEAFRKNWSTGPLEQRLRNYKQEDILSFISRKNVIPQYGFPVDTVSLAITSKRADRQFGVELQRDLAMAISEYAPGSQVVANGELFTGRYVRKIPQIGWKTYDYVNCEVCGTLNIDVHTLKEDDGKLNTCKMCGGALDRGAIKTFIIPSFGFEIDPDNIRKPGLVRPQRTYRTDASYVGYRGDIQLKSMRIRNSAAMVMFSEKDEMAILNKSDFHICEICGYGTSEQSFLPVLKKEHNAPSGRRCGNSLLRRYSLGYRFETDVFQIYFPDHSIPYGNEAEAYSVMYALLRGIVDVLNLEDNDVSGCLQTIMISGTPAYSFILYDTTPGGAGHMRRLQDEAVLNRAVNRASEFMKRCTCGGSEGHSSCYTCLRNYGNQKFHDILDRSLAWRYFDHL